MNTIYLAWEDRRSHQWFPVGRLMRDGFDTFTYEFTYTRGVRRAKEVSGFIEIPGFPKLDERYLAEDLFPAFLSRTMNASRPDRPEYLSELGLDEVEWDALAELSVSGGRSMADAFEVFPEVVPDGDGHFETRFVLPVNRDALERADSLQSGDRLRVLPELNLAHRPPAISVMADGDRPLGPLPRYLVDCMHRDGAWLVEEVYVSVAQVNRFAPLSNRLLVDFRGRLPRGVDPMRDLDEFKPIGRTGAAEDREIAG